MDAEPRPNGPREQSQAGTSLLRRLGGWLGWALALPFLMLMVAMALRAGSMSAPVVVLGVAPVIPLLGAVAAVGRYRRVELAGIGLPGAVVTLDGMGFGLLLGVMLLGVGEWPFGWLLLAWIDLVLLLLAGFGLAWWLMRVRLGGTTTVILVTVLSALLAALPFISWELIEAWPSAERNALKRALIGLSPVVSMAAECFGQQLLQKPLLYMQHLSPLAGEPAPEAWSLMRGWRLWALALGLAGQTGYWCLVVASRRRA